MPDEATAPDLKPEAIEAVVQLLVAWDYDEWDRLPEKEVFSFPEFAALIVRRVLQHYPPAS